MNGEVRDENLLRSLEPTSLAGYLKSRSWGLSGKLKPDVPVFVKGDLEVFLPLSRRYADYGLRMGELLREVSVSRLGMKFFLCYSGCVGL